MKRKQAIIIAVVALIVVIEIVVVVVREFGKGLSGVPPGTPDGDGAAVEDINGGIPSFTHGVPEGAELSETKNEGPASANPELGTKARFFDLTASTAGFEPESLVVNKGDTLYVDFHAVDGDYDMNIPYLGAYFSVVREGTTRQLPFDTTYTGTFTFACRDFCPAGGKIYGHLIVKPIE